MAERPTPWRRAGDQWYRSATRFVTLPRRKTFVANGGAELLPGIGAWADDWPEAADVSSHVDDDAILLKILF